jgi:hypothetical protein
MLSYRHWKWCGLEVPKSATQPVTAGGTIVMVWKE